MVETLNPDVLSHVTSRDVDAVVRTVLSPDGAVHRHVFITSDRYIIRPLPRTLTDRRHDGIDWWVIAGWAMAAAHPELSDDHLVNMIMSDPAASPHPIWIRSFRDGVEFWRSPMQDVCPARPALA